MKNPLIKGTIILTVAGILTRIIGFLYRILLADSLGETDLGIYQLIFPIYGICFTLYAAGIQTAVSGLISYEKKEKHPPILKSGFLMSLSVSLCLSVFVTFFSDTIACHFLMAPQAATLLRILAVLFPFCGITSIINGYFYGIGNAKIPATSQIIEQIFRVGFVFFAGRLVICGAISKELAVWGLVCGELTANLYSICRLCRHLSIFLLLKSSCCFRALFSLALPLAGNKLVLSVLSSLESVLIPAALLSYGFLQEEALGIYGVLSGIVLPFLLFPGTITNSLSVLLLPEISSAAGNNNAKKIKDTTGVTLHYSLLLGILASGIFLIYGKFLGNSIFHSANAGKLLTLLAFICPFLYASTTLSSVINGLGKTGVTFFHNVCGIGVRIICLVVLTPHYGIFGYLLGVMTGQILTYLMHTVYLYRKKHLNALFSGQLILPFIFSLSTWVIMRILSARFLQGFSTGLQEFTSLLVGGIIVLFYLVKSGQIRWKDFKLS